VTIGKQDVLKALAELRVNRTRQSADRHIRHLIRTYGNGATSINELSPELYESVWRAAGGSISFEEFYGVALDVPAAPRNSRAVVAPRASSRPFTPLVAELERLLAARAGKPRSKPTYVVNIGNPSRFGDEDAVPDYPSDARRMS
jgi:hypothetical protein